RRNLQRPEQITSFSYDEERRLFHDDRSLKYFHAPPMKVDLGRGMENLRERDPTRNEHLDSLLYSLMHLAASTPDGSSDFPRRRADVITWRGMATKLFSALYEEQNTFSMNVMLVNDTLYIEEWVSLEAKAAKEKQMQDERQRRMGYYGYAFESWCTHSRDVSRGERIDFDYAHDDPWDGDVNTNVQWCSVVKTKLGELRLILGGEVDCVDPRPPAPDTTSTAGAPPPALVELKTTAVLRRPQDEVHFEKKMLRFFLQSYLLGVDRVLVGFRDQRGFLQATHEFKTVEMPGLLKGKPHAWDRGGCCNLAWAILNFVRERVR
ncbi:RAI1-domain-containing protein, partial [Microstroma glucosiphilum]